MTDERPSEHETSQAADDPLTRAGARGDQGRAARKTSRSAGDPLTRILRHTDTARDAALDPVEKARMRSAIGAAAGQRSAAPWWIEARWMQAGAAAAVLLLAVAAGLWSPANAPRPAPPAAMGQSETTAPSSEANRGRGAPLVPETTNQTTTASTAPPAEEAPTAAAVADTDPPIPADTQPRTDDPSVNAPNRPVADATPAGMQPRTDVPSANAPNRLVGDPPNSTGKQPRTVRFTAPRGTRIIWTLDPNFESPTAGSARSRQEN